MTTSTDEKLSIFMWGLRCSLECAQDIADADANSDRTDGNQYAPRVGLEHAAARAQQLYGILRDRPATDLSARLADLGHRSAWQVVTQLRQRILDNAAAAEALGWIVTSVELSPTVQP